MTILHKISFDDQSPNILSIHLEHTCPCASPAARYGRHPSSRTEEGCRRKWGLLVARLSYSTKRVPQIPGTYHTPSIDGGWGGHVLAHNLGSREDYCSKDENTLKQAPYTLPKDNCGHLLFLRPSRTSRSSKEECHGEAASISRSCRRFTRVESCHHTHHTYGRLAIMSLTRVLALGRVSRGL